MEIIQFSNRGNPLAESHARIIHTDIPTQTNLINLNIKSKIKCFRQEIYPLQVEGQRKGVLADSRRSDSLSAQICVEICEHLRETRVLLACRLPAAGMEGRIVQEKYIAATQLLILRENAAIGMSRRWRYAAIVFTHSGCYCY
jgi:hypothetical protein